VRSQAVFKKKLFNYIIKHLVLSARSFLPTFVSLSFYYLLLLEAEVTSPKLVWPVSFACCCACTWPWIKLWQIMHLSVNRLTSVTWWLERASADRSSACFKTERSVVGKRVFMALPWWHLKTWEWINIRKLLNELNDAYVKGFQIERIIMDAIINK
jgi:hypothetical protein